MKLVVAPASFKGSLTARAAADAIAAGLRRIFPQADLRLMPLADGGEGTLDALATAFPAQTMHATVSNADGAATTADYLLLDDDTVAIEAAQIVGYGQSRLPVAARSSAGIGELIRASLDRGRRRFIVGVGGTSTNDGGAGLLAALGVILKDARGESIAATPAGLMQLARVDFSALDPRILACEIILLTDVDNPLCGAQGATWMYGPQKGVAASACAPIDAALAHFADRCRAATGKNLADAAGSGAAGGIGYALQLLGARRYGGAEYIAESIGLPAALRGSAFALTGEGRADTQTVHGKAPAAVARFARAVGVPVALLAGTVAPNARAELERNFDYCFALSDDGCDLDAVMRDAPNRLAQLAATAAQHFSADGGS